MSDKEEYLKGEIEEYHRQLGYEPKAKQPWLADDPALPACHSNRDGDCEWESCPQINQEYRKCCIYYAFWSEYYESRGFDYGR